MLILFFLNQGLVLLGWFAGWYLLGRILFPEKKTATQSVVPYKKISIIVPVRNEEKRILPLLKSLGKQEIHDIELIFVDDASEDNTISVIESHGFSVISCPQKPENWLGKNWAVWHGVQKAQGDYYLFIDADVWFQPGGLDKLLQLCFPYHGVITVHPYHRIKKGYENISGIFNLVSLIGEESFIANKSSGSQVGVFGPCYFCSKTDYYSIGGHESVKSEIVEDFAIGGKFRKAQVPVHGFTGKGFVEFQMYPLGLGNLLEGWIKNMSLGAYQTRSFINFIMALWIIGQFASLSALIYFAVLGGVSSFLLSISGILIYIIQFFLYYRAVGSFSLIYSVFYLLNTICFISILSVSAFKRKKKTEYYWKNRAIKIDNQ